MTLWKVHPWTHFTDKETEAQRGIVTYLVTDVLSGRGDLRTNCVLKTAMPRTTTERKWVSPGTLFPGPQVPRLALGRHMMS